MEATETPDAEIQEDISAQPTARTKSFQDMANMLETSMKDLKAKPQEPKVQIPGETPRDVPLPEPPPELKKEPIRPPEQQPEKKEEEKWTSPKAADWKKLKEQLSEREAKIAERDTKLAEMEAKLAELSKSPPTAEFDSLKLKHEQAERERAELITQLEKTALERNPIWSRQFEEKFASALSTAKEAVGAEHADKIAQLMDLPSSKWRNEQINSIRENLIGVDQGRLDSALYNYDVARSQREAQLKEHKVNLARAQQMDAERRNRDQDLQKSAVEQVVRKFLDKYKDHEVFKPIDGDDEFNATIDSNRKYVERFLKGELSDDELGAAPISVVESKRLARKVKALEKALAEKDSAIKEYQTASAQVQAGAQQGKATNAPVGFIERFRQAQETGR